MGQIRTINSGWRRALKRSRSAAWYLASIVLATWAWKGPILAGFTALIGLLLFAALYIWIEATDDSVWNDPEGHSPDLVDPISVGDRDEVL